MIALFWAVALGCVWRVFGSKRRFDIHSVALAGALVYFSPGFFGWVGNENRAAGVPVQPIHELTYVVWITVLLALVWSAAVFDKEVRSGKLRVPRLLWTTRALSPFNQWAPLALSLLGALVTFSESAGALSSRLKVDVMESVGRWHILWYAGAVVGGVYAAKRKSQFGLLIAALLAGAHAVVGFRLAIGTGLAAILAVFLSEKTDRSVLLERKAYVLIAVVGLAALFLWKPIYPFLKTGDIEGLQALFDSTDALLQPFWRSEPFGTQAVLNEVLIQNFGSSGEQFLGVVEKLRFIPTEAFPHYSSFNEQFQPALFPWAKGGLAGNPWAEAYALFGLAGVGLFLAVYVYIVRVLSRWLLFGSPPIQVLAAILGVFWAVYFHRNQVVVEINLAVRLIALWGVATLPQLLALRARGRGQLVRPVVRES